MTSLKGKLALNLKNAQRILDQMRYTHRQRIQQELSEEDEDQVAKADHTFQSPQTIIEDNKTKDKQNSENKTKPRKQTVADILQLRFLKKTYEDYCADLAIIQENEANVLQTIEKIAEKLNGLKDSDQIISRLKKKNTMLEQQLGIYEKQNRELDQLLVKQHFSQLKMIEMVQKNIRNLIKAEQAQENEVYLGFVSKWNDYVMERAEKPQNINPENAQKQATEDLMKLVSQSTVSEMEPTKPVATMIKKKSEINSELLGNLKEFSKNLKLPSEKKK